MSRISQFRPLRILAAIVALTAVAGMSGITPAAAGTSTVYTLTVHYYRADNTYTNWNLWSWVNTQTGSDCSPTTATVDDGAFPLTGSDAFGMYGSIQYTCSTSTMQQAGLIVRQTGWTNREPPGNRYISFPTATTSVSDWVISGDPNDYSTLAAANAAKYTNIASAKVTGKHTIVAHLTKAFKLTANGIGWSVKDLKTKKTYKATASADANNFPGLDVVAVGDFQSKDGDANDSGGWNPASTTTRMKHVSGDLYEYSITLPAGSYNYKVAIGGAWSCGTCSSYPGNNVSLELDGSEQVTFYFVPYGDQVYDSINNPTAVLPPSTPGFATNIVKLSFKSATLNTKDKYTLKGPGVPAATFKG